MAGISILIFGSCYASNYYFYYCRSRLKYIWTTIALITNLLGFISTMSSTLHKLKYAWIKGVIFSIIGILNGMSLI